MLISYTSNDFKLSPTMGRRVWFYLFQAGKVVLLFLEMPCDKSAALFLLPCPDLKSGLDCEHVQLQIFEMTNNFLLIIQAFSN